MSNRFYGLISYMEMLTGSLSVVSCLWYFSVYFRQKDKPIQLSLIFVLLLSDCFLSANILLERIAPGFVLDYFDYHLFAFIYTLTFSTVWSAIIAYFVYRSFLEYDFNAKQVFLRSLLGVILVNFLFTFGVLKYSGEFSGATGIILLTTLSLSILSTAYFYWKSARLASPFMEYEPQSTKTYIRSMTFYSLAQIFTYFPFMLINISLCYFPMDGNTNAALNSIAYSFAGSAGFLTVLVFMKQGPMGYHKPKVEPIIPGDSFSSYENEKYHLEH